MPVLHGEEQTRRTVSELLETIWDSVTHLDGKLLRSLKLLFTRPGRLTVEYMRGARGLYVGPFQLFVMVNVAFLAGEAAVGGAVFATPLEVHVGEAWQVPYQPIAKSMLDRRLAATGLARRSFEAKFNAAARPLSKSTVLLIVPLLALALAIVGPWRRIMLERLVFGLHVLSAALAALLLFPVGYGVARWLWPTLAPTDLDALVSPLIGVVIAWYVYKALRTLTPQPWWVAALRAVLLVGTSVIALQIARFALFVIALYAVGR